VTKELRDTIYELSNLDVVKGVLSIPKSKTSDFRKCVIRRLSNDMYQFERFTEKQAFHENVSQQNFSDKLCDVLENEFQQLQIFTPEYIYSLKITSKGKLLQNRCKNTQKVTSSDNTTHNKEKKYIINAENAPAVFYDLGIMSKDGKIVNAMYDKYRQICRFVEIINDVVSKDSREEYNIVDFGCGKSYLTFVVYHYMTAIMGKKVKITGLDLKLDVLDKCREIANKYNYKNMEFLCMDIKDYNPESRPDMVIALHACDIATDFALYNAYLWQADYVFSVPCCQHELNSVIKADKLSLLCDYGLIKERFSALATDAVRAKLLEFCGYKVDVIEFINDEFSPKNILIRASRTTNITHTRRNKIYEKILSFKNEFSAELTLDKLIQSNVLVEKEFTYVKGKASMLLKDVIYLRKLCTADTVRDVYDDTSDFICVYSNDSIVYCSRLDAGIINSEYISDNVSKDDLTQLHSFI